MSVAYPLPFEENKPVYRAYVVVADHFRAAEVLDCANDECAKEMARPLLARGDAVEVWERGRFITRFARD